MNIQFPRSGYTSNSKEANAEDDIKAIENGEYNFTHEDLKKEHIVEYLFNELSDIEEIGERLNSTDEHTENVLAYFGLIEVDDPPKYHPAHGRPHPSRVHSVSGGPSRAYDHNG